MFRFIKTHKRILVDFFYSFIAYALPTIVLQFVVQPLIAERTSSGENGLFVALFNVVKLTTGIFIMPLANLRLLKKNECEKENCLNAYFNFLFVVAISCSLIIGSFLNGFYRHFSLTIYDIIRFLIILLLMSIHDYYMIAFRLILNYKKIVIDNFLIVIGYGLGILMFIKTGLWELIFICAYFLGTVYVLCSNNLWKNVPKTKKGKHLARQYGELSVSDLLKNSSTYCDRLIIYPVLGGYDVSVYNAASVVSKAISVISSPIRNVLLSYIVNNDGISISKKRIKRTIPFALLGLVIVYFAFWGFSVIACHFLYPKYAESAEIYIPIIIAAIIIETCGAIMNIALLRFAKTRVQTIISALKLLVYFLAVFILAVVAKTGLWGFCIAIFIADITYFLAVLFGLRKNIIFTE